ncbi:helix-turn-helix domain-containing protein [Arthrobacter sp. HLT1-20]
MYEQVVAADSTTATMDEWLTPKEICSLLQIPEQTFYQWRAKGVGPHAYRIGRHLRVTRKDLNAWLAQRSES